MTCFLIVWAPRALSYFTAIASILITLTASIGNGLIIFVTTKDPFKKLHTPFNYFLVNLAVSDLIVGLVTMPSSVVFHFQESDGWFDLNLSVVLRVTFFISSTASLLSLIVLSLDRYVAICRALKYRVYFSWNRCKIVSVVIWVASFAMGFVYLGSAWIPTLLVYTCSSVLIGFIVLIVVYIKIDQFMKQQTVNMRNTFQISKKVEKMRLQQKSAVMKAFFTMLIVFIATNITGGLMTFTLQFCESCDCTFRHTLRDLSYLLFCTNSCINPFICTIRLKPYLQAIQNVFGITTAVRPQVHERVQEQLQTGIEQQPQPQTDVQQQPQPQTGTQQQPQPQTGVQKQPQPQTGTQQQSQPQTDVQQQPQPQTGVHQQSQPQTGPQQQPQPQTDVQQHPQPQTDVQQHPQPQTDVQQQPQPQTGTQQQPQSQTDTQQQSQPQTHVQQQSQPQTGVHQQPQPQTGTHQQPQPQTSAQQQPQPQTVVQQQP